MEHFLKLHTSTLLHFGGKYCTFLLLHLFGNFSYYLLKKKRTKKRTNNTDSDNKKNALYLIQ